MINGWSKDGCTVWSCVSDRLWNNFMMDSFMVSHNWVTNNLMSMFVIVTVIIVVIMTVTVTMIIMVIMIDWV